MVMTQQDQDYDLIQRFFEFELNDEDRQAVEQRLLTEPDFRLRMQLYQSVHEKIDQQTRHDHVSFRLRESTNTIAETSRVRSLNIRRWLALAASVLLLIAVGSLLFFQNGTPDSQALALEYWEALDKTDALTLRSGSESDAQPIGSEQLQAAYRAFDQEEYATTLAQLDFPFGTPELNTRAQLLRAAVAIEQQQYDRAIVLTQTVLDNPAAAQRDQALWYQALIYSLSGNAEAAQPLLWEIVRQRYPQRTQAERLLEAMH